MSELVKLIGGPRHGDYVNIPDAPAVFPLQQVVVPSARDSSEVALGVLLGLGMRVGPTSEYVYREIRDVATGCRVFYFQVADA